MPDALLLTNLIDGHTIMSGRALLLYAAFMLPFLLGMGLAIRRHGALRDASVYAAVLHVVAAWLGLATIWGVLHHDSLLAVCEFVGAALRSGATSAGVHVWEPEGDALVWCCIGAGACAQAALAVSVVLCARTRRAHPLETRDRPPTSW